MNKGMYGEMPKVTIGKFTISQMTDKENEKSIWMEEEGGEGAEFDSELIEEDLQKLFNKHF